MGNASTRTFTPKKPALGYRYTLHFTTRTYFLVGLLEKNHVRVYIRSPAKIRLWYFKVVPTTKSY